MKKSEIYKMAQVAVLDARLTPEMRLEMLKELFDREYTCLLLEESEAKKNNE